MSYRLWRSRTYRSHILYVVDLPERLSLMIRFFPCFKLMFRRYLWTADGTGTSGPDVITCCGDTHISRPSHIKCSAYFNGHTSPMSTQGFPREPIIISSKKSHCALDIFTKKVCDDMKVLTVCYTEHLHLAHERSRGQNHWIGALYSIICFNPELQFAVFPLHNWFST